MKVTVNVYGYDAKEIDFEILPRRGDVLTLDGMVPGHDRTKLHTLTFGVHGVVFHKIGDQFRYVIVGGDSYVEEER